MIMIKQPVQKIFHQFLFVLLDGLENSITQKEKIVLLKMYPFLDRLLVNC